MASNSDSEYFHTHETASRLPLTVSVSNDLVSDCRGMTPSPRHAEEPCFCRWDLFRRCVVGGEATASNLIQSPPGLEVISPPVSATPLHCDVGDDEHDLRDASSSPSNSSLSSSSSSSTMRLSSPAALRRLHKSQEERWEEIEDHLLILLNGRLDHLQLFRKLHNDGIQNEFLLESLAYLSSVRKASNESAYYEHISAVAAYLGVGRAKREDKLAVIRALMTCLSPPEALWQVRDAVIEGTLDFITCRPNDEWEFMEHSETTLIWELRAMALRLLDRVQERVARVAKTGDSAAIMISVGVMLVEEGMMRAGAAISSHIELAGGKVKDRLRANHYPLIMDRDAVIALTFSDAAKRASVGATKTTKLAMAGIRDASNRGLELVANQFENGKVAESLTPEGREALRAAGKVSLVMVGAAAIVGEALLENSRAVMEKTAVVTADVVKHKYGNSAGQVASDAGETVVNVMRALGSISAVSEGHKVVQTISRGVGKEHAAREAEKAIEAFRLLEGQATTFFNTALGYSGNVGLGRLAAPSQAKIMPIVVRSATPKEEKVQTESIGGATTLELAPSSCADSTESSSGISMRRSFSGDEEISFHVSNQPKSNSSTSSVTIATRRSPASR